MIRRKKWLLAQAAVLLGAGMFAMPSMAQTQSDQWKFTALIYGYFPQISGSATFPTGTTASITTDPRDYIGDLKGAFMGALQAEKGQAVFFTDLIYANVKGSKSQTQDFSLGSLPIPAGVTLDATLKVESTLWTIAGGYRFINTPEWALDLFAGARDLVMSQTLNYNLSANVGPIVGNLRQGQGNININNWDGIVGAKGRYSFGDKREWFVPYYADVGTGQDVYTYQLYTGLGYTFSWGELVGVWRYIDYKLSDSEGAKLKMNGPAIGVAFHW
jgi:hypothetical protein